MPTNVTLDESLISEAMQVGNHQTKEEAVIAALREYIHAHKRREILDWVGKVDYYDDYDPKRLRYRKPLSADQQAALQRILSQNHHLGGRAPSRDELHEH